MRAEHACAVGRAQECVLCSSGGYTIYLPPAQANAVLTVKKPVQRLRYFELDNKIKQPS